MVQLLQLLHWLSVRRGDGKKDNSDAHKKSDSPPVSQPTKKVETKEETPSLQTVQRWLKELESWNETEQHLAIAACRGWRIKEAFNPIMEIAKNNNDERIRKHAANTLYVIDFEKSIDDTLKAIKDSNVRVRRNSVELLKYFYWIYVYGGNDLEDAINKSEIARLRNIDLKEIEKRKTISVHPTIIYEIFEKKVFEKISNSFIDLLLSDNDDKVRESAAFILRDYYMNKVNPEIISELSIQVLKKR